MGSERQDRPEISHAGRAACGLWIARTYERVVPKGYADGMECDHCGQFRAAKDVVICSTCKVFGGRVVAFCRECPEWLDVRCWKQHESHEDWRHQIAWEREDYAHEDVNTGTLLDPDM